MSTTNTLNRRQFLGTATAATSIATILPRRVLGGPGYVAPNDKINLALIGSGTMGINMLMSTWLPREDLHISCIADPNRKTKDYRDWSPHGIRNRVRDFLGDEKWGVDDGILGGREVGQNIVETYYGKKMDKEYKGCTIYSDYRELLEQEEDIDGILCMTPEHLHATICIAAMKKGKHAISHKTLSNVLYEARLAADTARETGVVTHLMAWQNDPEFYKLKAWIDAGVIGKVREVHNWSNRPIWPQGWLEYPQKKMKVPRGMDWDLWLGPVPDMPYHLDLTHALFRGWYNFGSGCMGDMGNYSLWRTYRIIDPGPVVSVEARATTGAEIVEGNHSRWRKSEVAFPNSSTIHFTHKDVDIFWYDGGMRPCTPREVLEDGGELAAEGMMYVGEYGKILGDFHCRRFKLIPNNRNKAFEDLMKDDGEEVIDSTDEYMTAMKEGKQSRGSFQEVQLLAEATCLGNIALRAGQRLHWDHDNMRITNLEEANALLRREYRPGWEL